MESRMSTQSVADLSSDKRFMQWHLVNTQLVAFINYFSLEKATY